MVANVSPPPVIHKHEHKMWLSCGLSATKIAASQQEHNDAGDSHVVAPKDNVATSYMSNFAKAHDSWNVRMNAINSYLISDE